jgi:hypothetical protein
VAINFKLADRFAVVVEDPMERDWVGWDDNVDLDELFDRNRGVWAFAYDRANRERVATFSHHGVIKMVAEIDGIEEYRYSDPTKTPKRAVVGHVLRSGPIWNAFIGTEVDAHRSPFTYIPDPR